jgi:O-antigen/teichoic acid export membrane protein
VKKTFPYLPLLPYQWNKSTFVEIIGYGTNLQLITIIQMLYEPVTKSLLTKFGGLAAVGYYEMANRFVLKTRELIVSVFQVLVPVYATHIEENIENIKIVYSKSLNYLLFLAIPLFSLLIITLPLISIFLLGRYENLFYTFALILSIAWFINIITVPAYHAFLGIGTLRWNVFGHLTILILNLVLCYTLGSIYGGSGTILGWALSIITGSLLISFKFNASRKISFYEITTKENKILFLVSTFTIITFILVNVLFTTLSYDIFANAVFTLAFIVISFYFILNHSVRRDLFNSVKQLLSSK